MPVTDPDEVPETVTGSALAICAALKIARSAMLMANGLSIVAKFFIMYLTFVNPFYGNPKITQSLLAVNPPLSKSKDRHRAKHAGA